MAYRDFPANPGSNHSADIWVMNADGSERRRLTHVGVADEPAWGAGRTKARAAYVMDVDGTHARRLSRAGDWDYHPVWSPGGTFIAYASDAAPDIGDGTEIVIVDADSGGRLRHFPAPGLLGYEFDWAAE